MRVVFFGTPLAAVPSLEALNESEISVELVVTQRARGIRRGRRQSGSPVSEKASELGLETVTPGRVVEIADKVSSLACDAGVIVAYGQLIPGQIIELFPFGMVNLHLSLLPRWRGAAPVQRAILEGDTETGVSVMLIDEGLDTGPVISAERVRIGEEDDATTLTDRLARRGASLLIEALSSLAAGSATLREQDDSLATLAPRLTTEECRIDWTLPAYRISRLVRATSLGPAAWTTFRSKRVNIRKVRLREDPARTPGSELSRLASGEVRFMKPKLLVGTGDVPIEVVELQVEGKNPVSGAAFAAGARLGIGGDKFD